MTFLRFLACLILSGFFVGSKVMAQADEDKSNSEVATYMANQLFPKQTNIHNESAFSTGKQEDNCDSYFNQCFPSDKSFISSWSPWNSTKYDIAKKNSWCEMSKDIGMGQPLKDTFVRSVTQYLDSDGRNHRIKMRRDLAVCFPQQQPSSGNQGAAPPPTGQ